MKTKKWMVAIGLGLIAGGAHLGYVRGLEREKRGGELVTVLAVAKEVSVGKKVAETHLGTRQIPAAFVDPRAVGAEKLTEIVGLVPSVSLRPGQLVQWTDFSDRDDSKGADLAGRIESGKRGVTISVDRSLSMGGLLRPGHRVDILGTFASGEVLSRKERITATLLQNVLVLATGATVSSTQSDKDHRFSTVTLSVGLEEAEILALAAAGGKLSIVLRGHQDLSTVREVPEKKMADILDADQRARLNRRSGALSNQHIERLRPQ